MTGPIQSSSKELFHLRMEGFGVGTWDFDLVTRELAWSETTRSLFGVARDAPVSYELFLSLLEPAHRERADQAISKVVQLGGNLDISFRVAGRQKQIGRASCRERV